MRTLVNLLFLTAMGAAALLVPAAHAASNQTRTAGVNAVAVTTLGRTTCVGYRLDRNRLDTSYRILGFDPGSMTDDEVDEATVALHTMKSDPDKWCAAAWRMYGSDGSVYPDVLVRY